MDVIPEDLERGPWEGHTVCDACKCGLHENRYYANNSVCPHCGASYQGTSVIVRRKVFLKRVYKQPWWQRWLGVQQNERGFRWEVKKADG